MENSVYRPLTRKTLRLDERMFNRYCIHPKLQAFRAAFSLTRNSNPEAIREDWARMAVGPNGLQVFWPCWTSTGLIWSQ